MSSRIFIGAAANTEIFLQKCNSFFRQAVNVQRRIFLGAISSLPALALGGGSIHGIAHVGALKAFAEKGLKFDFIAGTNAGAILGVLAAAQLPHAEIERIACRIEWPGVRSLSWSGKGLMQNANLRMSIDAALPRADIAIRMNLHEMIDKDDSAGQLIAAGYAATMRAWSQIAPRLS